MIVLQEDRQDSLNLDALINLGITYINIGQNEKAIECYEKAAEINQEESVVFNHAMCLLTILKRKETKEFVEVWKVKGSRARMLFERTLEINAGNLVARLALVELGYILEMN